MQKLFRSALKCLSFIIFYTFRLGCFQKSIYIKANSEKNISFGAHENRDVLELKFVHILSKTMVNHLIYGKLKDFDFTLGLFQTIFLALPLSSLAAE